MLLPTPTREQNDDSQLYVHVEPQATPVDSINSDSIFQSSQLGMSSAVMDFEHKFCHDYHVNEAGDEQDDDEDEEEDEDADVSWNVDEAVRCQQHHQQYPQMVRETEEETRRQRLILSARIAALEEENRELSQTSLRETLNLEAAPRQMSSQDIQAHQAAIHAAGKEASTEYEGDQQQYQPSWEMMLQQVVQEQQRLLESSMRVQQMKKERKEYKKKLHYRSTLLEHKNVLHADTGRTDTDRDTDTTTEADSK